MAETKNETNDVEMKKVSALQTLVERHYVPSFVSKLAEHNLELDNPADIAHALQLNGKFSSLINAGANPDKIVGAIVERLKVKRAYEQDNGPLTLSDINHSTDDILKQAGFELGEPMMAKQADALANVDNEDLEAVSALMGA